MGTKDELPKLLEGQVAAFMAELSTGILLGRDKKRSLNASLRECCIVFDSVDAAIEAAELSIDEDKSIEWVILAEDGTCLKTIRPEVTTKMNGSRLKSWIRRVQRRG